MNRKSAFATAGALTASFVAGAAAVSFNWGLGTPTSAAAPAAKAPAATSLRPIVRHRMIVIHKTSPASPSAPARTVVVSQPVAQVAAVPATATTSGSHAGAGHGDDEGDGGDD